MALEGSLRSLQWSRSTSYWDPPIDFWEHFKALWASVWGKLHVGNVGAWVSIHCLACDTRWWVFDYYDYTCGE